MSNGSASGGTAETTVCNKCYRRTKSHTCDCRGRIQHFSHSRTTLRSLITDDNNVTFYDLSAFDCRNRVFLAVKYSCRSFMNHHLCNNRGTFYDASVWCKIAPKYSKSACGAVWIVNRTDYFRVQVYTVFDVLTYCFSGYSHALCVKESLFIQLVHNCVYAACFVQVFHVSRTCRCKVADVRSLCTDFICKADIEIPANLMCDCRKMKHTVCRTAKSHIYSKGIQKCLFRHNISWTDVAAVHFHNLHSCMLCKTDTLRIYSRDCSVSFQAHTKNLSKAVHAVCSVHTGTGTAGRTCFVLTLSQSFLCKLACCVSTNSLKHAGKTCLVSV